MPFKNSKIWVVDDDILFVNCVKEFFDSKEYITQVFSSPHVVLESLSQETERPQLILSDLHFPDESGFDLVVGVKAIDPDLPVIIMSGDSELDVALKAVESGAYDYILKPLHLKKLLLSIQRALHQHRSSVINKSFHKLATTHTLTQTLGLKGVVGTSPKIIKVFDLVKRVAPTTATVCISGESGTGKEIVAKSIHELSDRAKKPFVAVNCSAIPETLLESELFGHAKGSFTGAIEKKLGLFETADGGTLFLDEIGELSLPLQAKLLRVIQERQIKRVGENIYRNIDVRILTATHRDMQLEVAEKRFREDLFYRLNVIPIHLPPLRERKEDIVPLANFFLVKLAAINKTVPKRLSAEALQFLYVQEWPGNARELENTLERATIMSDKGIINVVDFMMLDDTLAVDKFSRVQEKKQEVANFFSELSHSNEIHTLDEIADLYIQFVLQHTVGAKDEAAKLLGIDRKTLYRRMSKLSESSNKSIS